MKHEHFKSFKLDDEKGIVEFLNGKITAKSISITNGIVVFGYVDSASTHHYSLVTENLGEVTGKHFGETAIHLDNLLAAEAAKHTGVICQHVDLGEDTEALILSVTFLVAHEK